MTKPGLVALTVLEAIVSVNPLGNSTSRLICSGTSRSMAPGVFRSVSTGLVPMHTTRFGNSGFPVASINGNNRCGTRSPSNPAQYG